MAIVTVNGIDVEIGDDERLNGVEVAKRAGVDVPHYCWHPGLSVVASCRMCLVESGRRDPETGEFQMIPKLIPACQTPATDGTVFVTESDKVEQARAMVEEDLLINHPVDCPICDKAGECYLQDYHFKHGQNQRRADIRPFTSRKRPMGDTVMLFVDRCVMCTRCVRFTREISGTAELMVTGRGASEEIDVFPGFPLDNKLSGNVVDICPVGALGDREFLYRQRVWFMKSHDHVCAGCSAGCSIHVDENQDQVYRLRPRENPHVNRWWMCDDGRYGWKPMHDAQRLTEPMRRWRTPPDRAARDRAAPDRAARDRAAGEPRAERIEWPAVAGALRESLANCGRIGVVLSPQLTVEEAYLLALYVRSIDDEALLALGPVKTEGEDESFPGGFTIRAEKCPNRRGVEEVVSHFSGACTSFDAFLDRLDELDAAWVTGGWPGPWIDQDDADRLGAVGRLVVQDVLPSPLWEKATLALPGAAPAEREGSFVNCDDRLQSFRWAVRPPVGAKPEGHVYWELLGRPGMYNAAAVLRDVAAEIAYFSAAGGDVPDLGVDLRVNLLV